MFSQKNQLKFEIISKLVGGLIDTKIASKALNVSYRTVLRYKKSYLQKGSSFLVHGNTGRPSANAKDPKVKNEILELIKSTYYDFNLRHAWEKLANHNLQYVSYRILLRWCQNKKFIGKIKRKSKRVHRARM